MDLPPTGDDRRDDETLQPDDAADRIDWTDDPHADADGTAADEVAFPEPPDDDYQADVWPATPYAGPPLPVAQRGAGWLSTILLVVLALAVIGATVWGVLEYRQRAQTQVAAQQAIALISDAAPPEIIKEVTGIQEAMTAGRSDEAAQRLATLRTTIAQNKSGGPGTPGLGGGGAPGGSRLEDAPIPESAYSELPAEAATFFRQHENLFRRFVLMCSKARELRDAGQNVDELRKVRNDVIKAAGQGNAEDVEKQMVRMMGMLREQGGGGEEPGRGPLGRKAQQLKRLVQQAEREGKDIRPVLMLMQKTEQAATAGRMDEAGKYIDQAMAATQRLPRRRGGRGMGDMRRRWTGVRPGMKNPLAPFARVLLSVMGAEERDLKTVTDYLLDLRKLVVREEPPVSPKDELAPVIDKALAEMQVVSNRRQDLAKAMRGQRPGKPGQPGQPGQGMMPPPGERPRLTADERRQMFAILLDRVVPILERVRGLSNDDYLDQRGAIVRELVRAVTERPRPSEAPGPTQPTVFPSDPEQRVRAKMMQASPVVKQWELLGRDTSEVEKLFAQARKELYARRFTEAEKLVDDARKLLGLEETPPAGTAPGASAPTGGGINEDVKLDLRAH